LWDISAGNEVKTFTGHWDEVMSVCFSVDGKTGLSGSRDGSIILWGLGI
jgi:WD40 repeat protein